MTQGTFVFSPDYKAADIEAAVRSFHAAGSKGDLRLPSCYDTLPMGGTADVLQAVITWSKANPNGRLVLEHADDLERYLRQFVASDHGLIACLQAQDIITSDHGASVWPSAYRIALARLKQLSSIIESPRPGEGSRREQSLLFIAADDTTYASPRTLYYREPNLQPKSFQDFGGLARIALRVLVGTFDWARTLTSFQGDLGTILAELFQNTHEWARTNERDVAIKRSVRGIRFVLHHPDKADESAPLTIQEYCRRFTGPAQSLRFLETSVFDSGPGMVKRWHAKQRLFDIGDLTTADEYSSVLKCLRFRATTSNSLFKGLGLNKVLITLSQVQGFLHIRTGRLRLYRDFARRPLEPNELTVISPGLLLDSTTLSTELSRLPPIEGTLITILVPIQLSGAPSQ